MSARELGPLACLTDIKVEETISHPSCSLSGLLESMTSMLALRCVFSKQGKASLIPRGSASGNEPFFCHLLTSEFFTS